MEELHEIENKFIRIKRNELYYFLMINDIIALIQSLLRFIKHEIIQFSDNLHTWTASHRLESFGLLNFIQL